MTEASFTCDLQAEARPLSHVWEHTVGSGHALLGLRADWQKQLARCHDELGFRHVRFHGLLSDDVGTLVCEKDKLVYSFFNADQIFDFLMSIGVRPFVELSFMPVALSSGSDVCFSYRGNVTPPKKMEDWAVLIQRLVRHWVERYGLTEVSEWFFEVWNEPNLKAFWTGSQADYFSLYASTAQAIKAVSSNLRVGGPATANNAWIPDLLEYCEKHAVPVDFISTHHYPTDAMGKPGDDTLAQLAASRRSILREQAEVSRSQAGGRTVYYTEWSTSSNPFDPLHDLPYAAAFITKTVMEARELVGAYSYWTFSDIFAENYFSSVPFHGGFGLLTIHGIPKPAYRAYQLLRELGDHILPLEGHHETVDVWVTRSAGALKILMTNSALPRHPVQTERVRVCLRKVGPIKSATLVRIDDSHANPRRTWEELGSPESLSPQQVEALQRSSSFLPETMETRREGEEVWIEVLLPPQGTACGTLEVA